MNIDKSYLSITVFLVGAGFGALFGFWTTAILLVAVLSLRLLMQQKALNATPPQEAVV